MKYEKNFEKRFKKITKYFLEKKLISKKEYFDILQEKLFFINSEKKSLPYVIDFINSKKNYKNKQKINLTIDYNLTLEIDEIAKKVVAEKSFKNF